MHTKDLPVLLLKADDGVHDARFVMSASSPDRMADTIDPKAYAPNLGKRLIALFQHKTDQPIGYWDNLRVEAGKLLGDIKFASTALAQMVKTLIDDGVPLAASIGFRGAGKPNKAGGIHFDEVELLECSVVSVPAHPLAQQIAKNFGIDLVSEEPNAEPPAVSGDPSAAPAAEPVNQADTTAKEMKMSLSEKINVAKAALQSKKDILTDLTEKFADTPQDAVLSNQIADLSAQIEADGKSLSVLVNAEKALAERIESQAYGKAPAVVHSTGKAADANDLWVKEAVCKFLGYVQRKSADEIRAERYASNKALEAVMTTKSAVPLATTFTPGWAAELMATDVRGFVTTLAPTSVAAALALRSMMLDFGGFDSVSIPRRNARKPKGENMGGAFVGEGGAIPLGQMSVGASKLSRYKQAVISTFSKELAERSTPAIEAIIRQAILEDMSIELDGVFLGSAAAVAGVQPAGIANGVAPVAGTAGGGIDAIVGDVKAAMTALTTAGLGVRPVMLINQIDAMSAGMAQSALGEFVFRNELSSGRLLGVEVVTSLNIPKGTTMLVDAAAIATAFDAPQFDVSDQATVVEVNSNNTAPTMNIDAAGALGGAGKVGQVIQNGGITANGLPSGAGTAGATARSLWQTWSIGIRSVQPVSWGVIQPGAVAVLNNLTW